MKQLTLGIIGMGGFAGMHHNTALRLEDLEECRLCCTCDPVMEQFAERKQALRFYARGIHCYSDHLAMLDTHRHELDVVTIPTPIPLHAPMHRACVERGLAVYLEKPPTLDSVELERMLAVEARAQRSTMVGFNFIVEPQRLALKQRLLAGEFGRVRRVGFTGRWPRSSAYYGRANWAGRLRLNGRLVLDSCLGNAMAHYTHNVLFWGGIDALWSWGHLDTVEAELYRAHAIEGTDTVFVKAHLTAGPEVLIAMTHACDDAHDEREWVECELATIAHGWETLPDGRREKTFTVTWQDGRIEREPRAIEDHLAENFRAYFRYLCGKAERPITRLEDCRPFVALNNLAYLAAGHITTIAPTLLTTRTVDGPTPETFVAIPDIDAIFTRFTTTGTFPSAQPLPWSTPGGTARLHDLPRLSAVISAIVAEQEAAV